MVRGCGVQHVQDHCGRREPAQSDEARGTAMDWFLRGLQIAAVLLGLAYGIYHFTTPPSVVVQSNNDRSYEIIGRSGRPKDFKLRDEIYADCLRRADLDRYCGKVKSAWVCSTADTAGRAGTCF